MRRSIVTIVFTLGISTLYAQPVWLPGGPQQVGGTYSQQFQHVFSALHNQAALAALPAITAGVYAERRFMLKATSLYALGLAVPTASGTFGLSLRHFGYTAFNQQQLGIAYGRNLGSRVSIGMQVDYLGLSMQQYGRTGTVTFEAGCLFHVTPQLHAGVHAFNPVAQQLDKSGRQDIPVVYTAGAGYEASRDFLLSAEVVHTTDRALTTRLMCEYRIVPQLSVQLGLSTDPQLSGGGVRFSWQSLHIYLSAHYHSQLGITPATAITWQPHPKEA